MIPSSDIVKLTELIERRANEIEPRPCYWFSQEYHDAGDNFCYSCAKQLVDELHAADPKRFEKLGLKGADDRYRVVIDGGFEIEHDSPPSCIRCNVVLEGSLTDHGTDTELDVLMEQGAPEDDLGWHYLNLAIANLFDLDPRWEMVAEKMSKEIAG